jgi:FdhD protein
MARDQVEQKVWAWESGTWQRAAQTLLREVPFEIQLRAGQQGRSVLQTTRTPGHDYELAAGFLYSTGYLQRRDELAQMTYCVGTGTEQAYNLLTVTLRGEGLPQPPVAEQVVVDGIACGVSSQTLLEAWERRAVAAPAAGPVIAPTLVPARGAALAREATPDAGFAALLAADGEVLVTREDATPQHALHKVVGWGLLEGQLPFHERIVIYSGRVTFAAVEAAIAAGASLLGSARRPSSLALSLAYRCGLTLLSWEGKQVTVYTGRERLEQS